jgi:hypothetical protein
MKGTTKEKGSKRTVSTWLCAIAMVAMLTTGGPARADDPLSEVGLFTAVAPMPWSSSTFPAA